MTERRRVEVETLGRSPGVVHAFELRGGRLGAYLPYPLARLRQVHGDTVHRLDSRGRSLGSYLRTDPLDRPDGDALITDRPGITVAVATADCAPVLVGDLGGRAVAAAHAGWRGLAAGVLEATVDALSDAYGIDPDECVAAIGPTIGPCCYVVGDDVVDAFEGAGLTGEAFGPAGGRRPAGDPPYPCDLRAAARRQLRGAGLPDTAIETVELCTHCNPELLWSYRRHGDAAGRMLSGIAIEPRPA